MYELQKTQFLLSLILLFFSVLADSSLYDKMMYTTLDYSILLNRFIEPMQWNIWTFYKFIIFTLFISTFGYIYYATNVRLLNRIRKLQDVGYIYDQWENKKDIANNIMKLRGKFQTPPVYPNGWFGLIEGSRLKVRESRSINVLGLNLAVFRGENGDVYALDAYCPHMGANLGVGGKVVENCIECPFHGWKFKGETGKCVQIPYMEGDKIPPQAQVSTYITEEVNGWIYLWYDAEGRDPLWRLPPIDEIHTGAWTYRGRTEHYINCHIEEVPENGADFGHLPQVHSASILAGADLRDLASSMFSSTKHWWTAEWNERSGEEAHIGVLTIEHSLTAFGYRVPFMDVAVEARQIGPGVVYMFLQNAFGKWSYLHHMTPVEPLMQKMVHNIYAQRRIPTALAKILMICESVQVERDIMLWNNKKFINKPVFVKSKEDTSVSKHRRWYQQFYSANSPRLGSGSANGVEW